MMVENNEHIIINEYTINTINVCICSAQNNLVSVNWASSVTHIISFSQNEWAHWSERTWKYQLNYGERWTEFLHLIGLDIFTTNYLLINYRWVGTNIVWCQFIFNSSRLKGITENENTKVCTVCFLLPGPRALFWKQLSHSTILVNISKLVWYSIQYEF